MEHALDQGEYLLVNKMVYFNIDPQDLSSLLPFVDIRRNELLFPFHPPHRGEIIIFSFPPDPSRDFVKRVIGVPGDTVEMRAGTVYVNGERLDEPYITSPDLSNMAPFTVPPESYFVLGDNRGVSNDSRAWDWCHNGPPCAVPIDNLVGRAWVTYWPLGRLSILNVFSGL